MKASTRRNLIITLLATALSGCVDDIALGLDAAPPDAVAPPDAEAAPANTHVVYLAFEGGITLTHGAADSPSNNLSAIVPAPFTPPPFLMGVADRADTIDMVATEARSILAPYDVALVSTRPTSGAYDMIVFGGHPQDVGSPEGVGAIGRAACQPSNQLISLVFEAEPGVDWDPEDLATTIVALVGMMNGVPTSTLAHDCMCWNAATCVWEGTSCTIGGAGTPVDSSWTCDAVAEMDEHARFLDAFGAAS